jgi:hypothetical protein
MSVAQRFQMLNIGLIQSSNVSFFETKRAPVIGALFNVS